MRKIALAVATVATVAVGSLAASAPAEARYYRHHGFGVGPGLAFGLMAGAIAAATAPSYYYGYGPGYYDPYYYPAYRSYGYYGGPGYVVGPRFYHRRHWHHW